MATGFRLLTVKCCGTGNICEVLLPGFNLPAVRFVSLRHYTIGLD